MKTFRYPAYIVLEIPPPIRDAIQKIRDRLATPTARMPVEVTVAGSSGSGPIKPGTPFDETVGHLESVMSSFSPFNAQFGEIRAFPNTDIYYLAPVEREPFDALHAAIKSGLSSLGNNPWPYNPHCTLRVGPMVSGISAGEIFASPFPKNPFVLDTVSIYELNCSNYECTLVYQKKS